MRFVSGSDERGSAALEFVALGTLLLVPLVYLILVVGQLQAAALAADGAARSAARSWVMQQSIAQADQAAAANVRLAAADFGFDVNQVAWQRSCTGTCLSPQSRVTVRVTIAVPLPLTPAVLHIEEFGTVRMSGDASQTVSRFRGAP